MWQKVWPDLFIRNSGLAFKAQICSFHQFVNAPGQKSKKMSSKYSLSIFSDFWWRCTAHCQKSEKMPSFMIQIPQFVRYLSFNSNLTDFGRTLIDVCAESDASGTATHSYQQSAHYSATRLATHTHEAICKPLHGSTLRARAHTTTRSLA